MPREVDEDLLKATDYDAVYALGSVIGTEPSVAGCFPKPLESTVATVASTKPSVVCEPASARNLRAPRGGS